ncbi:TPA: response regulator [Acinetobacter baumannii]|nr:response regulator [Acinetobacter baumannii]HAV5592977.1 response regulator [Acinetobacter baumannii]
MKMNTQTHVNSHKQTMAVPNFEVWKNAFVKLLPQHAIKNPVMAIVWLGTVVTGISTILGYTTLIFGLVVTAILFITILFANYAEAVAEARGRGQASSLRAARENLTARRLNSLTDRQATQVAATELHLNDFIEVHAGELVPADGEIVEGFATINESAVTGESAPVLREAGTDRSGVIGGTKVLTDRIVVQVTAESGQSFLDRMIALVEGSNRQKTPDLGLPDLDGKEVLQELRSWSNVPVIVLSVRADEYEKVALLDAGANDYMTKPFSVQELLARIRVILRNQPIQQEAHIYDDGYLKVDVTQRLVWIEQQPITLTRKEFQLLTLLMRYQGQLLTQPQLLKELWGPTHQEDTHYLRILVGKLRSKLGDNAIQPRYIATEPGVGLRFLAKQKNH